MSYIRPKKYLGQHFLTDKSIAERTVDQLSNESDTILEIGPGKGILTGYLIKRNNLFVIEIDDECVVFLKNNFQELEGKIIHADFLKFDLNNNFSNKISVIGNFPYNISSQIFFKILENRHKIIEVVCMLQKEVAQRIASPPGSRDYGILSVLLQAFYDIEYLFSVKPGSFFPPPKVNSGVIRLTRNKNLKLNCNEGLFFKIVKTAFNQRRKTLANSLKVFGKASLTDPVFIKRPEQLDYKEFIYITNFISSFLK